MKSKRIAEDWLKLWGEWEFHKKNVAAGLNYQSSMAGIDVVVLHDDTPPAPALTDDDQPWLCDDVMAKIKRESNRNYRILKMKYMHGYSQERIRAYLKVGKNNSYLETQAAIFYAECVIRKEMPHKLIDNSPMKCQYSAMIGRA